MNQRLLRNFYLPLAVLTTCFVGLYYHVIAKMVIDWSSNDNYSHGFMIPLVSAFLIWQKREELWETPIHPSNIGLFLLAFGLSVLFVGTIGAELFTMRFSMLIVLVGLVVYLGGWEFGKMLSIPIGYLIFMIPLPAILWNKIAFPLRLFATKISVPGMQLLGIPVYREGNIINLANTSLEVVDVCSGLRSLTSLLALSALFALVTHHSKTRKWVLFLAAIPIAILANVLRLIATAFLSQHYGSEVAQGFLHEASGILVFILAFMFLFGVHVFFLKTSTQKSALS